MIKHWLTERDNETFCPVRICAILGLLEFLALAGYVAIASKTFDVEHFGIGLSAVLVAVGAAVTAKATTEAKP